MEDTIFYTFVYLFIGIPVFFFGKAYASLQVKKNRSGKIIFYRALVVHATMAFGFSALLLGTATMLNSFYLAKETSILPPLTASGFVMFALTVYAMMALPFFLGIWIAMRKQKQPVVM